MTSREAFEALLDDLVASTNDEFEARRAAVLAAYDERGETTPEAVEFHAAALHLAAVAAEDICPLVEIEFCDTADLNQRMIDAGKRYRKAEAAYSRVRDI